MLCAAPVNNRRKTGARVQAAAPGFACNASEENRKRARPRTRFTPLVSFQITRRNRTKTGDRRNQRFQRALVAPGLDPGAHRFSQKLFSKTMDCRVKPGNDGCRCCAFTAALAKRPTRLSWYF